MNKDSLNDNEEGRIQQLFILLLSLLQPYHILTHKQNNLKQILLISVILLMKFKNIQISTILRVVLM